MAYFHNTYITCNDKDAPWVTTGVKSAIRRNSRGDRKWVKRGKNSADQDKVREVQNITNSLIREAKQAYYENLGNKLSNSQTGQEIFLSAFKRVTNKKSTQVFRPLLIITSTSQIRTKKLIYSTIILPINATFVIMGAAYRNLFAIQIRLYLVLTSLSSVLQILLKSITLTKLTTATKYKSLCYNYARLKLPYNLA